MLTRSLNWRCPQALPTPMRTPLLTLLFLFQKRMEGLPKTTYGATAEGETASKSSRGPGPPLTQGQSSDLTLDKRRQRSLVLSLPRISSAHPTPQLDALRAHGVGDARMKPSPQWGEFELNYEYVFSFLVPSQLKHGKVPQRDLVITFATEHPRTLQKRETQHRVEK